MKFSEIYATVGTSPCSDENECRMLYDWVLTSKPAECLELGFAYGKSSCIVAAAFDELGRGHLTTIDLESARKFEYETSILDKLKRAGLERWVTPIFSPISYTWELMKIIEKQSAGGVCSPLYDFIFLDGSHLWETDTSAFFLATKLLKAGGWFLFDDYLWTLSQSDFWSKNEKYKNLPEEYLKTPHVQKIVQLLVAQSPDYEDVVVRNNWAWARKKGGQGSGAGLKDLTRRILIRDVLNTLLRRK